MSDPRHPPNLTVERLRAALEGILVQAGQKPTPLTYYLATWKYLSEQLPTGSLHPQNLHVILRVLTQYLRQISDLEKQRVFLRSSSLFFKTLKMFSNDPLSCAYLLQLFYILIEAQPYSAWFENNQPVLKCFRTIVVWSFDDNEKIQRAFSPRIFAFV